VTVEVGPPAARAAADSRIDRIYELQRRAQPRVAATGAAERIQKIRRLHDAVMSRRDEIRAALLDDYGKPAEEVDLSEIFPVLGEARHAMRHLRKWMKPQRVAAPVSLFGTRSRIFHEAKGVVLIISPWNFPVNLTFGPVISAIAAGNCVIAKPSEMTPHTSACMKRIVADLFDEGEVAVIEGDAAVAQELLRRKFDHIFFTGSPRVGRVVMKAAAEHLASVTLELGGKSPVIVDRTADLDEAAKKIAWGKSLNSGQVCIAPDYLLVDEAVREPFIAKLRSAMASIGDETRGVLVHDGHALSMRRLFDDALLQGAEVLSGGASKGRQFEPTLLTNVNSESAIMQQEIFGPLLPLMTYRNLDDALQTVARGEKPLVLYVFSRDRGVVQRVIAGTSAGGTVVNDTLVHFYQLNLPFGGVGQSGIGKAHGRFGFEAFSNARGVLEQPTRFSMIQLLYPPYTAFKRRLIDFTLKYL
jgi:aldehyde dehydrogenase (NAD+)